MNKSAWVAVTFAGLGLGVACGGSSTKTVGDSGDEAGAGGDAGTGRGGQSGTSNGGGGTTNGGSSGSAFGGTIAVGGSSDGGTIAIGGTVAVGGSSTGGIGTSGSPGTGGATGVCALPLVTGNCDAYFPSFGFSTADGNCQRFIYGGCSGNDNRFETLAECEATCGGSLSDCPARNPMTGTSCSEPGQICSYDYDECLCSPTRTLSCNKVDGECVHAPIDAGISEIVVVLYTACTCTNGTWACQLVFSGGL